MRVMPPVPSRADTWAGTGGKDARLALAAVRAPCVMARTAVTPTRGPQ